MNLFKNDNVNLKSLHAKAYNYRWATLEADVIPLTAADPDFPVAKEISNAIINYCADGYFSYSPADGLPEFKIAIANWYKQQYQVDANPHFILPLNSAAFALFMVAKMILKPGDNAIIPNPVDFLFRKSIENTKAQVRTLQVNKTTAQFNLNELEANIDNNTKAIFICNPNNPLGTQISENHLSDIIHLAKKYNLWIVADEIWADIYYLNKTTSIASIKLPKYDKKIIISGLSKNFALAGLRVGYAICQNKSTYNDLLIASKHKTTAYGVTSISQIAATAALTHCNEWLKSFRKHLCKMNQLTNELIQSIGFFEPILSNATYLAFPKIINTKMNSFELVNFIQKNAKVALIPGGNEWFESASEGHIRISYATSTKILTEAFDRIKKIENKIVK